MTIANNILKYVREKNTWINGGDIEKYIETTGHKGSTAARVLRTLSKGDKSLLQKEERKGVKTTSMWYRARQPEKYIEYRVNGVVVSTQKIY